MASWVCRAGLLVAGLIHCLPLAGLGGGDGLQGLYGLASLTAEVELLLRHRAVLFGLLGALLIAAAWIPRLRSLALLAGLISAISFLALAGWPSALNEQLTRVWWADVVAIVALLVAWAAHRSGRQTVRHDEQQRP